MQNQSRRGILRIHTGKGKGKTTAALGLALWAASQGQRVYMVQFLKGRETGESLAIRWLLPNFTLQYFGRRGFINSRTPAAIDHALANEAWRLARQIIRSGAYDLVILDELIRVLAYGLLPMAEVLQVLQERPAEVNIVVTGRQAQPELIALADQVIEMRPVKHYYEAGVYARLGIEW